MSRAVSRFAAVAAAVIVLVLAGAFLSVLAWGANDEVGAFADGWTVELEGAEVSPEDVSDYILPKMVGRGDVITLKKKLPKDIGGEMSVRLLLYLSAVDAEVDGVPRYSYGDELLEVGHFVGSGYHYIPLFPPDGGKTLTVTIRPTEDNAFSNIAGVALIPSAKTDIVFAKSNLFSIFVSIFLEVLGTTLLALSVVAHFARIRKERLFYIGCFSLLMGLWSMGSDKILQLFYGRYETVTAIEYITLYLALVPFLALVIDMRLEAKRWKRIVLYIAFCVLVVFDLVAVVLHAADIAHFPVLLGFFHFLAAACVVALIIAAIQPLGSMVRADRYLNIGIVCLVVTGVVDIVRFNLQKYLLATNHNLDASVLPFGVLAFIVLLIMSYLVYLFDEMIAQTEKRMLEGLAYEDPLTKLGNRTRCEERFAELKESRSGYAIINIDLNGLKRTNDTLGHAMGDELIASFGGILKEAFTGVGECFRMGGDEFLVIVPDHGIPLVAGAVEVMEKESKERSKQKSFMIEAAWGMAEKAARGRETPEDIYRLADEKMYQMKKTMKETTEESR